MRSKKQYIYIALYLICILYITILSRVPALVHTVRSIPLWSFLDWFKGNWARGGSIALNIIMFIPLGYLLAGMWEKKYAPVLTFLVITLAVEAIQFVTYRGFFDVDDIITNVLGGVIGTVIYWQFGDGLNKWPIPTFLILAGIVGCIITTGNQQIYVTQFDFQIQSVEGQNETVMLSGTCDIYRRDALPFQIQLKGKDGIYQARTEVKDTHFTATVEAPDSKYEVDVVFQGYQPISTGTYINGSRVEYVQDAPAPIVAGTDLEDAIKKGVLKVYNENYDTYIYQVEDRLYWLIGSDFDASVIYHLYTEEKENLPENRQQYGFDNRGFRIESEKDLTKTMNCGAYRVFSDIIPTEYSVTAIAVGMNKGPDIFWREYFRPNRF